MKHESSNQKKFFKLLAKSNELKKNKRSFRKEQPEEFEVLFDYLVIIEENYHYSEKDEYIELAKALLDVRIDVDDFSYYFIEIYQEINKKLTQLERNESSNLANFLGKTNSPGLGRLLARIYGFSYSFIRDPNMSISDQEKVEEYAKILLLALQGY